MATPNGNRAWVGLVPGLALAICVTLLALDHLPRFFQGDSISYLTTGLNGWVPPDRSWAYGFASRWLVEAARSVCALVAVQAVSLLGAILFAARIFGGAWRRPLVPLIIVAVASLDPLNQTYARFWLSDTIACAAFIVFVSALAASVSGWRPHVTMPIVIASAFISVFVRVAYAPIEVGTLLIAYGSACLMHRNGNPPQLRRHLLAPMLVPILALVLFACANAVVLAPPLRGTIFVNRLSTVFTLGVFLPALEAEDFRRAGIKLTDAEFTRFDPGDYHNRIWNIWADDPHCLRAVMQQKLGIYNIYDGRIEQVSGRVLRYALLHHPQTMLLAYFHGLALYFAPAEWSGVWDYEMGFQRPLPSPIAAVLSGMTRHAVSPRVTALSSLLPAALGVFMPAYPVLLVAGAAASALVLLGRRPFGMNHMLGAALLSSLLVAPLYSLSVIPRYLVATVLLAEILLVVLAVDLRLQVSTWRRSALAPAQDVGR